MVNDPFSKTVWCLSCLFVNNAVLNVDNALDNAYQAVSS